MLTRAEEITVHCTGDSMAFTQSKFVKKHLNTINSQGILKVWSITSEASASIIKSVHDYVKESYIPTRHYKCFIHILRSYNFRGITLTSSPTGCSKGIFMWKLSSNIRSRLRIELTRIKNSTTTEDSFLYRLVMQFKISYLALRMTTETAINIHLCVMRICKHILLSTFHMELNIKDGVKLNGIIEKHFSETELSKNSALSTINKCESLHHKVFTFAPTSNIYTRNFAGLCHSAVHSSSLGNGLACIDLANIIELKYKRTNRFIQHMKNIDTINRRNFTRKKTRRYTFSRCIARHNKRNRTLRQSSLFNCSNRSVIEEPEYANSNNCTC